MKEEEESLFSDDEFQSAAYMMIPVVIPLIAKALGRYGITSMYVRK